MSLVTLRIHTASVRAGSIHERCAINQSAKPALVEAEFHSVFKSFPLFLGWAGLAEFRIIGVRDWDPPVQWLNMMEIISIK